MTNQYTPPNLDGHKILYNDDRYVVFEVDGEYPYEGYEELCEFVIFDKSDEIYNGIVASCNSETDGTFSGSTPCGQASVPFNGKNIKELLKSYISTEKTLTSS